MRTKYFLNLVLIVVVGTTAFLSHPWQVLAQTPATSVAAEPGSRPVTAKNNLKVFEVVWTTINKEYYDSDFNGVDWVKSRERFQPRVAAAATEKELYELLREMVAELKDNHVSIKSPEVAQLLKRRAFPNIGAEFRRIDQHVLVTEVKVPSSASEAGIQPGWILTSVNDVPV
jgi:C-terminal processing protease CtpA/Prc